MERLARSWISAEGISRRHPRRQTYLAAICPPPPREVGHRATLSEIPLHTARAEPFSGLTILRIWLAYRTNAMRYDIFRSVKTAAAGSE